MILARGKTISFEVAVIHKRPSYKFQNPEGNHQAFIPCHKGRLTDDPFVASLFAHELVGPIVAGISVFFSTASNREQTIH